MSGDRWRLNLYVSADCTDVNSPQTNLIVFSLGTHDIASSYRKGGCKQRRRLLIGVFFGWELTRHSTTDRQCYISELNSIMFLSFVAQCLCSSWHLSSVDHEWLGRWPDRGTANESALLTSTGLTRQCMGYVMAVYHVNRRQIICYGLFSPASESLPRLKCLHGLFPQPQLFRFISLLLFFLCNPIFLSPLLTTTNTPSTPSFRPFASEFPLYTGRPSVRRCGTSPILEQSVPS